MNALTNPPRKRLLIVEDEGLVAADLRRALRVMGHEVVGTGMDYPSSLQLAQDERPDLALIDIGLQGELDGIEVAKQLRDRLDIPCVFLTARSDRATMDRAGADQPFGYLLKPFNDFELRVAIEVGALHHAVLRHERHLLEPPDANAPEDRVARWTEVMSVAHQFNHLLSGILGNVSLMRLCRNRPADIDALVAQIEQIGARASRLCDQLLQCADERPANLAPVKLSQLLEGSIDYFTSLVPRNIRFDLRAGAGADAAWVRLAEQPFRRLITNLITNAIEAIDGREGRITLRTARRRVGVAEEGFFCGEQPAPGEYVSIAVENTGPPIAAEQLHRIFEPFFTTRPDSRGLGLAECQTLARQTDGVIAVRQAPAGPVMFEWLLPLAQETELPPARSPQQEWRGSGTLLIIDDNARVREHLGEQLRGAGYQVMLAGDGEEGLKIVREPGVAVDAILVDAAMPRLGGVEVLRALRDLGVNVPVFLLTGFVDPESLSVPPDLNVSGFILKPISAEQLRRELERVLPVPA